MYHRYTFCVFIVPFHLLCGTSGVSYQYTVVVSAARMQHVALVAGHIQSPAQHTWLSTSRAYGQSIHRLLPLDAEQQVTYDIVPL
jgi:hypothetical protein